MATSKMKATAGVAVAAGLVAAPLAMAGSQAWADPDGETTTPITKTDFTIKKDDANAMTSYKAVQIFTAEVDDENGKVKNVKWVDGVEALVVPVLEGFDPAYTGTTAQEAAEFIADYIGNADRYYGDKALTDLNDTSAILGSSDLGMEIAAALADVSGSKVEPGTATELGEGYWVIIPDEIDDNPLNSSVASPYFVVAGFKSSIEVAQKTSAPTLTKEIVEDDAPLVKDDESGAITSGSHANGETITYKLTGKLPSNLDSFSGYEYNFYDTYSYGLDIDESTVKVTVDDKDVTEWFTVTDVEPKAATETEAAIDGKLTIACDDIKASDLVDADGDAVTLSPTSVFVVTYYATQIGGAHEDGVSNSAELEYTHAPGSAATAKTSPTEEIKDYSYALQLNKVDHATGESIVKGDEDAVNAKFTVTKGTGTEMQYVKVDDGKTSLTPTYTELSTNDQGVLVLDGIDAGEYTVTEVGVPTNYQGLSAPFTVTVTGTPDSKDKKTVAVSGDDTGETKHVRMATVDAAKKAGATTESIANVENQVNVGNVKLLAGLPITGEQGIAILVLAGGAIVVASAIGLARNRRHNAAAEVE